MTPLPLIPLKRFGRVVGGATPTSDDVNWGGEIPWYTPTDVSAVHGGTLGRSGRTLTEEGLASCSATLLPARSVVLTSRAPIGNVAITDRVAATNQGCKTFVPNPGVDARFVAYSAQAFLDRIQAAGTGTTFQEVSGERLATVRLPYADGELQRTIADFLDHECERVAQVRRALVRPLVLAQELPVRGLLDHLRELDLPPSGFGSGSPAWAKDGARSAGTAHVSWMNGES